MLERILAREGTEPSATSQRHLTEDPAHRLKIAAERYSEAVTTFAVTPGGVEVGGGRPLPWLAPLPVLDGAIGDYLTQRHALVVEAAATITSANLAPGQWSRQLKADAPELARELAVWRAATGASTDPSPTGPADCPAPDYRHDLTARVAAVIGEQPVDKWAPLLAAIEPRLLTSRSWVALAADLERAAAAGFDVAATLPALITDKPLPDSHIARAVSFRLAEACPAALEQRRRVEPAVPNSAADVAARTEHHRQALRAARALHVPAAGQPREHIPWISESAAGPVTPTPTPTPAPGRRAR
jgi:hypothetical protein